VTHLPARRSGKRANAAVGVRNPRGRKALRPRDLGTPDARERAVVAGESVFRVHGRVAVPQASNENDDASAPERQRRGGAGTTIRGLSTASSHHWEGIQA